jgi:hypothetical protein
LYAGWAANSTNGDASVYVFTKDFDKAMLILDEINAAELKEEEKQQRLQKVCHSSIGGARAGIYAL